MKYLGERSLSSVISKILHVAWYVVFIMSIVAFVFGTAYFILRIIQNPTALEITNTIHAELKNDSDWQGFSSIHPAFMVLIAPYFILVVGLLLKVLTKARFLFNNFKKNIVFEERNVEIISSMSKLMIAYSILTFDFSTLMVSVLMLILCEIFKNGTALQKEHDLTV